MGCVGPGQGSAEFLLTAGTALAIEIARCLSAEEVGQLAAFLTVLGDQLALLALNMPQNAGGQGSGSEG